MRWYLENFDEPKLFWDADFEETEVTITSGTVGGESTEDSMEFESLDELLAHLRGLTAELFRNGYEVRVAPDERYQPDPRLSRFWNEELLDEWKAMGVTEREPDDYADLWRSYAAVELPSEVNQFLDWRASHAFGYCNYGEWRIWDADCWLPRRADGNLFEQLVIADQENYLGTAMMEHLASWICVGSAGNGDTYYAHPNQADPGQAEIVFFNHETHTPEFFIADSLATLAWANHCYNQLESDDFDHDAFTADVALIEDRATLSWHYGDVEAESEIEPAYEGKSRGVYYFYRTTWIDYLLRQNGVIEVEDVGDFFYPDFHAPLKFSEAIDSPYLRTFPVTALYWLWRLWWFKKPELEQCLDVVAEHTSPIVVDCVALIRELEGGRKQLGKIEDIHALRERFLALDLDPDRAEERAAEEFAAAQQAEVELAERLEVAHGIIASGDVEAVRQALWDFVGQPDVLGVLYEFLQYEDGEAKPWIRRWDFHDNDGASRDGRHYSFEIDEIRETVTHGGSILGPRFAGMDNYFGLPIAAATAGDKVRGQLVEALEATDKYRRGISAGARGLAALNATEHAPRLVELVGELLWDPNDYMAEIERKDALLDVVEALAVLGGDDARDALVGLLEFPKLAPRVLVSLGQLGDEQAIESIVAHVGTAVSRPALYALAHIGTPAAAAAIEAHIGTLAGGVVTLAYEHSMHQLAVQKTGGEVDWPLVERLTRVVESKKYEDRELHATLVQLLGAHPDRNTAVRLLEEALHHEYRVVRDAAIAQLARLNALPPLRWLDRPTVDALFADEGVEGLRKAASDPHAIFRHNVLRKAVDEGIAAELSDEACRLAEFYCRFTDYTNGYVQDKHDRTHYVIEALAQVGTDDAHRLLCVLWKGKNPMYREADVIKYDRNDLLSRLQPFVAEVDAQLATSAPKAPETRAAVSFSGASWLFGGCVNGLAWSPDGTRLAVGGEGGVKILDPAGQCIHNVEDAAGAWVYDVAFNHDGSLLAVGAHGGHLWLVDPTTGATIATLAGHGGVPNGVRKVRFSPKGKQLASCSDDRSLRIWDVDSRECTAVYEDPADINTVDWIDENTLVIGTDRMVRLVNTDAQEVENRSLSGVAEVRVNLGRKRIFVGTAQKKIRAYSLDLAEKPKEHVDGAAVARIRCREKDIVAASWEGDEQGLSITTYANKSRHLDAHHAPSFALDVHPKTGEICSGGKPGFVARWTSDGHPIAAASEFHTDEIASIRFCNDEVVTTSDDGTAIRWATDGTAIARYESPSGRLCDAVRDGRHVFATGSAFSGCYSLDGNLLWQAKPARSEHLSLTGKALIVASYNTLWWLDRRTGELLHETEPFADSFIFRWLELDDDRLAVAGYDDERLFVWNKHTRELLATWELPTAERGGICSVTHAAGKVFVSRWDKTVVVLDAVTGAVIKRAALSGTRYPIGASPDAAKLYATAGATVEVLDTETFEIVGAITVGVGLEELAVGPDGRVYLGAKSGELFVAD